MPHVMCHMSCATCNVRFRATCSVRCLLTYVRSSCAARSLPTSTTTTHHPPHKTTTTTPWVKDTYAGIQLAHLFEGHWPTLCYVRAYVRSTFDSKYV